MNAPPLFVELCAGLASTSLRLQGGPHARPPVSRMGNKAGYAHAILRVMGLRAGLGAGAYLWCEPDDGCRALLQAYPQPEVLREAAEVIRGWVDEDPRALWERLKAEGPIRGAGGAELARWLRIVSSNELINVDSVRFENTGKGGSTHGGEDFCKPTDRLAERTAEAVSGWPPVMVAADARTVDPGEVARWLYLNQGSFQYRGPSAGIGRPQGREGGGGFGAVRPCVEMLPDLLDPMPSDWPPVAIAADAREIDPPRLPEGCVAYMDPPYINTTGYGNDLPRSEVCELAERWASAGARVYISEAEPMAELGWHDVEITDTRKGQKRTFSKQKREFLTCSHPPAWRPSVQRSMFTSGPEGSP